MCKNCFFRMLGMIRKDTMLISTEKLLRYTLKKKLSGIFFKKCFNNSLLDLPDDKPVAVALHQWNFTYSLGTQTTCITLVIECCQIQKQLFL